MPADASFLSVSFMSFGLGFRDFYHKVSGEFPDDNVIDWFLLRCHYLLGAEYRDPSKMGERAELVFEDPNSMVLMAVSHSRASGEC